MPYVQTNPTETAKTYQQKNITKLTNETSSRKDVSECATAPKSVKINTGQNPIAMNASYCEASLEGSFLFVSY